MRPFRLHLIPNDWVTLERELNHLTKWVVSQSLAQISSPTFAGLTLTGLSGVLKATAGVVSDVGDLTDFINGTANEISVTDDGDGTVTVALADIVSLGNSV